MEPVGAAPAAQASHALLRVARTAYSEVFLCTDARLGRAIWVERFEPGLLQGARGATHLVWLRAMARLAGPGLQRILRIDLTSNVGADGQASAQVHFEDIGQQGTVAIPATLPAERDVVARVLRRLHGEGVVHGSVADSLVREPAHLTLRLHARGPLSWPADRAAPAPDDDLAALDGDAAYQAASATKSAKDI
jgi:hypothetical protein